ncbi:MAG: hypothetical protein JWQ97_1337, partial [Phenylobacterium sp.]|nr:hypothetical protein [Phenylobacterium sp.]
QARTAVSQNLSVFHPIPALYPLPALALVLLVGVAAGQPGPALLAAGGAFSVGFGAFQRMSRFHVAPMLLAALCMAIATAAGTALSAHTVFYVLAVAASAFSLGLAASFGTGPWWVLLQGAIFLVITGSQPGDLDEAGARALLVLGGGLVQSLCVTLLRALLPRGFPPLSGPAATPAPASRAEWLAQARGVFSLSAPELRYAALLGLASGAAILIEQRLALPNGYWVAMTVLLVLRRGGALTVTLGVQRIGGTLLGAGAATLIVALLKPDPWTLVGLIVAAAWCAYAMQWVNYGTFSIGVTSYIAFLLSLQGLPEAAVAGHRIVATLVGGVLGIAALGLARLGGRAVRFRI